MMGIERIESKKTFLSPIYCKECKSNYSRRENTMDFDKLQFLWKKKKSAQKNVLINWRKKVSNRVIYPSQMAF